MNNVRPTSKFLPKVEKIEELQRDYPRFKRIYSEYQLMTEELWILEMEESSSVPDDFINAVKLQASYLEDEIEDWLMGPPIEQ